MTPTSIAVGLSSEDKIERVMLSTGHVSTTVTKMISTQLIMAADLIEDLDRASGEQVPS
jgi:hypothetical protein